MRSFALTCAALVCFATAACSSDPGALPKVPEFTPAKTTTTGVDYSDVGLKSVPGQTPTSPVALQPGNATLAGTVVGDEGRIAGAKVNVERFVNGQIGQIVLLTLDDGTWSLPMVLGGRYRIRAWRAPDLAQTTATSLFLGGSESKNLELKVRSIGGTKVTASFAPQVPLTDRDSQLVVRVSEKIVSDDGIVRATPIQGESVELISSSGWLVRSANPATTDSSGEVDWLLRCRVSGRHPLAVAFGVQTVPLTVEECVDRNETTTTTDPDEIVTTTTAV